MTDDPEKIVRMDKKGSFPPSFSASTNKSLALDNSAKTSPFNRQDGPPGSQVSKVQPKTPNRVRGNQTYSSNSRNESSFRNKCAPQRGRGYADRRQKPRVGSTTASEPIAEGKSEPEVGSLQSPGGKKQNVSKDLWGFHFTPRDNLTHGYYPNPRRLHPPMGGHWRSNYYGIGGIRPTCSKDYLLANCQFLVKMGEDYTFYGADPDVLVRWDLIEQVRIRIDGEMPKCPICLDLGAPKITKCGHIYCWPCFLHYLALSDNKVRTCPICFEPVSKEDLKSVSIIHQDGIEIGSKIEMQLMVRKKDTAIAYPVEKFLAWENTFSKILQVTPESLIQNILINEHVDLDSLYYSDPDAPETCFVQQAMAELTEREMNLLKFHDKLPKDFIFPANGLVSSDTVITLRDEASVENTLATNEATDVTSKKARNDSVSSNSSAGMDDQTAQNQINLEGHCYFYQMCDGRNVFLHPLNMAMLWRELGPDPEKWPQRLRFEIIDIESKSATDVIRKRLKFIRHLPKNAPFDLVEVSMEGWGISPEVLTDFAIQIKQREQRRKNRAKEEKLLERKLRAREARDANKYLQLPQISSPQEFPAFGTSAAEQELILGAIQEEMESSVASMRECTKNPLNELIPPETLYSATSFAKIAGKAPMKKSPTFPIGSSGVWVKTPLTSMNKETVVSRQSDSENENEDYVPVPNYRASVSNAIEKALADLDLRSSDQLGAVAGEAGTCMGTSNANKKKKNKKGKLLFATNMGALN